MLSLIPPYLLTFEASVKKLGFFVVLCHNFCREGLGILGGHPLTLVKMQVGVCCHLEFAQSTAVIILRGTKIANWT